MKRSFRALNAPDVRVASPLAGLVLLACCFSRAFGASYYVANNGNDNWTGLLPAPNASNTDGPFLTPNKGSSVALPGDTVYFRAGTYNRTSTMLYQATLEINNSGTVGAPITYRNFPGETPIIQGTGGCIWAIRVGNVRFDGTITGVHDIIVDGLYATLAPWDGIEITHSYNITVRNCWAYTNNFNSPNGYKAGVNIDAGHDITIDHCRIYDNGFGICGYEDQPDGHEWPNPSGPDHVTLSNNFVFANSRTGNVGNSPGMDIRFATRCTYEGNIFYDNPDAGINGEGNIFCRVLRNICINNWQPGGNNEGGKICVRGGGCNVIAFNLFTSNNNCGWDATSGVGDVLLNNTIYGNGSWGVLAEGRETMLWNNIIAANSTRVTDNGYPQMDALGFSLVSDWNVFGNGPLVYQSPNPPIPVPSNTHVQGLVLPGITLPRTDVRQVNTPEMLWGVSTIEEARTIILNAYKPLTAIPGTTLGDVQARCNSNIGTILNAADAAIAKAANSPDFQMKQATFRWQQLKAGLTSYDLSGLRSLAGGDPFDLSAAVYVGAAQGAAPPPCPNCTVGVPGDFDHDGDVDGFETGNDYDHFVTCATRTGVRQSQANCQDADFDHDGDVDMNDFGIFQRCYTWPYQQGNPNCAH